MWVYQTAARGSQLPDERLLRQAEETLSWYFQDATAAQSGVHSFQAQVEARLTIGSDGPSPGERGPGARQLAHVRRARRVEARLGRMDPYGAGVLGAVHRGKLEVMAPAFGRAAGVLVDLAAVHEEYGRLHPDQPARTSDLVEWLMSVSRRFGRGVSGKAERNFVRRVRRESLRAYYAALVDFLAA